MALGTSMGDAYIDVHANTGPFRRELRRDAALAGREFGGEFGEQVDKAIDTQLSPLGNRIRRALTEQGRLSGEGFADALEGSVIDSLRRMDRLLVNSISTGDFSAWADQFKDVESATRALDKRLGELRSEQEITLGNTNRVVRAWHGWIRAMREGDRAATEAARSQQQVRDALKNVERVARTSSARMSSFFDATRRGFAESGQVMQHEARAAQEAFAEIAREFDQQVLESFKKTEPAVKKSAAQIAKFVSSTRKGFAEAGDVIQRESRAAQEAFSDLAQEFEDRLPGVIQELRETDRQFERLTQNARRNSSRLQVALADALGADDVTSLIAIERAVEALGDQMENATRQVRSFDFGLGRLKGSRNNFLNLIGSFAGSIERNFGRVIPGIFQGVGTAIERFGDRLSDLRGPLAAVGRSLGSFGSLVNRIGAGGLDGLIVQIAAVGVALAAVVGISGVAAAGLSTLAGVVALLSQAITTALSGGLLALGPGLFALAAGAAAATIGFTSLSKAQKEAFQPLSDWMDVVRRGVQERLFENLGQSMTSLADVLSLRLNPLLFNSADVVRNFIDTIATGLNSGPMATAFNRLQVQLPAILQALLGTVGSLSGGLVNLFAAAGPGAQRLFEAMQRVVETFQRWTESRDGQVRINVLMSETTRLLGTLWEIVKRVSSTFSAFWEQGRSGARRLLEGISNAAGEMADWANSRAGREAISRWFRDAQALARDLGDVVRAVVGLFDALDSPQNRAAFRFVVQALRNIIAAATVLVGFIDNVVRTTTTGARLMGASLARVGTSFQILLSAAQDAAGSIARGFTQLGVTLYSAGRDAVQGLINGITSAARGAIEAAASLASQVAGAFSSVLGISSPSRVFRGYGVDIVQGMVLGIRGQGKQAADAFVRLARDISRAGSGFVSQAFRQLGENAIKNLTNGLARGRGDAANEVRNINQRIIDITQGLIEQEQRARERALEDASRSEQKAINERYQAHVAALRDQSGRLREWISSMGVALNATWRAYDRATAKLESARERLADLVRRHDALRDQFRDQLRGELDLSAAIDPETGQASFESVQAQVSATLGRLKKFATVIRRLIKAGFPALLVQEVAGLGSEAGIAVGQALLGASREQQQGLISDFQSIRRVTANIGEALADQMFQAGIQAQQGLILGLESNQAALERAAKKIADTIADKVRKELGIRSPSTVFRDIGREISEGLALGIEDGQNRAAEAAAGLLGPTSLANMNTPLSDLGAQAAATRRAQVAGPTIAAGAIRVVTPFADPRLVALEVMDALAEQGK